MTRDIEVTPLQVPAGTMVCIVTAHITWRGKSKRVGHAYIYTDREPQVTIEAPAKLGMAGLSQVVDVLTRFQAELARQVANYGAPTAP